MGPLKRVRADTDSKKSKRVKHSRSPPQSAFSVVSDEILLRILRSLPIFDVTVCERVCRRFRTVALDNQLWKAEYYARFVFPRASRIPNLKNDPLQHRKLLYSSRSSKWLEDERLADPSQRTDWKRQYKIRHNWSKGRCGMSEIEVARQPPTPPLLVRIAKGLVFIVDVLNGLSVWKLSDPRCQLAGKSVDRESGYGPTAFAVDSGTEDSSTIAIAIAYGDGRFDLFIYDISNRSLTHAYAHTPSVAQTVTSIAISDSYVLLLTEHLNLSLWQFETAIWKSVTGNLFRRPKLVSSLKSDTILPPSCLYLRSTSSGAVASVAYAVPAFPRNWTIGLQELRINSDGTLSESRLSTALHHSSRQISNEQLLEWPKNDTVVKTRPRSVQDDSFGKPISISYTHPYLLTSHEDNTLTLHLVTSNSNKLVIGEGTRLWGHTSSISSAHIASRGRAVSVSTKGGELRLWELEGGAMSHVSRRGLVGEVSGVQVRAERRSSHDSKSQDVAEILASRHKNISEWLRDEHQDEEVLSKGLVGFDDENVVVLRQRKHGSQALLVYDFT